MINIDGHILGLLSAISAFVFLYSICRKGSICRIFCQFALHYTKNFIQAKFFLFSMLHKPVTAIYPMRKMLLICPIVQNFHNHEILSIYC